MLCHIRICNHSCEGNESKSSEQVSPLPPPPPPPLAELMRDGGPGLAWGFWAGKGGSLASKSRELKWRLFLASKLSGLKSHINPASCQGGFFWRVISAVYFGTFIWRVFMASKSSEFKERQSKEKGSKLCIVRGPLDRIMNIVYSQ
jgi:hypothetical protein